MKPITRIDMYLAVISGDEDAVTPLPEPITRIDMYLASIAGMDVAELPEPITRIDYYLAALCGMNVVIPDEPVTRIDFYLAALNGQTVDTPEAITRIDHYLDAWAGGSSLPWATFTGNPVQFNAPKAHTLRSTSVSFTPIQAGSGDPSPDNVRPISGWNSIDINRAGENLWNPNISTDGTAIDKLEYVGQYNGYAVYKIPVPANTQMRVWVNKLASGNNAILIQSKLGGADYGTAVAITELGWSHARTLTSDENGLYLLTNTSIGNTIAAVNEAEVQIELGSSASPYAPPTISTTTLTFPSTVYGGTAEVAEDGTGTGTGEWAEIDLGDLTYIYQSSSGRSLFKSSTISDIEVETNVNTPVNAKCEIYKAVSFNATWANNNMAYSTVGQSASLAFVNNSYTNAEDFKTAMTGIKLYYKKRESAFTPFSVITASSTPTAVKGINTMWTDGDTLTVEARAEAVNLSASQSLNMLLGGRYVNNHTEEDLTDEEALDVILGGQR